MFMNSVDGALGEYLAPLWEETAENVVQASMNSNSPSSVHSAVVKPEYAGMAGSESNKGGVILTQKPVVSMAAPPSSSSRVMAMSGDLEAVLAGYIDAYLAGASVTLESEAKDPLNVAVSEAVVMHAGQNSGYCNRVLTWLGSQGRMSALKLLQEDGKNGMSRAALLQLPNRLHAIISELEEFCVTYAEYCPGPYRDSVLVDYLLGDVFEKLKLFAQANQAVSTVPVDEMRVGGVEVGESDSMADDVSELGDASVSDGMGTGSGGGRGATSSSRRQLQRQAQHITRLQTELAKAKEALHRTAQVDVTMLNTKLRGTEADLTRARQKNLDLRDRVQTLERQLYEALTPKLDSPDNVQKMGSEESAAAMPEFLQRARRNAKSRQQQPGPPSQDDPARPKTVSISTSAPGVVEVEKTIIEYGDKSLRKEKGEAAAMDGSRLWSDLLKDQALPPACKKAMKESMQRALVGSAKTNSDIIRRLEEDLEKAHAELLQLKERGTDGDGDQTTELISDTAKERAETEKNPQISVLRADEPALKRTGRIGTDNYDMFLAFCLGVSVTLVLVLVSVKFDLVDRFIMPHAGPFAEWVLENYKIYL